MYGAAFVMLLFIAGITGVHVAPQPPREMLIFAALAVGPMLISHTGMNWAFEHLPAYIVNLTMLGEPVGAILLGMLLPGIHEIPRWTTFAGGAVVLLGVVITAAAQNSCKRNTVIGGIVIGAALGYGLERLFRWR